MPRPANDPGIGDTPSVPRAPRPRKKAAAERRCALTREVKSPDAMIRFVAGPDGAVVPDIGAKLPGRGVWVTASRESVDEALKKGVFARGFKRQVTAPEDLSDQIETALAARCQGLLGLAKKAGDVVLGFDQVRASLRRDEPGWLLEASDGAEDGRNKVHFLAKALYDEVKTAGALTSAELGMAFGRDHVIHGVLLKGSLADRWALAYGRLVGFRTAPETLWFSARDL